jgi:hypothetical protein
MANLTSTIAVCFFALAIPFNFQPAVAYGRSFPFAFSNKNYPLGLALSHLTRNDRFFYINWSLIQCENRLIEHLSRLPENTKTVVKECLDLGRVEILEKTLNSIPSVRETAHFMGFYLKTPQEVERLFLLGFNPNTPNKAGSTVLLSAILRLSSLIHSPSIFNPENLNEDEVAIWNGIVKTKGLSFIADLFEFTKRVDPRVRHSIDVHFKGKLGPCKPSLDAISRLLTGFTGCSFGPVFNVDSEILYKAIEKLVQEGAFIPSLGFESYRDFLTELITLYKTSWKSIKFQLTTTDLTNRAADALSITPLKRAEIEARVLLTVSAESPLIQRIRTHFNDNNELIRLAANILYQGAPPLLMKNLLSHADKLVALKPRIEVLWKKEGQKFIVPYKKIVAAGFDAIGQEFPQGRSKTSLDQENNPIVQIIAEYLALEPLNSF